MNIAPDVWSLILARGDATRLGSLTHHITGDARPKQFCPLLDGDTLLDRTRGAWTCSRASTARSSWSRATTRASTDTLPLTWRPGRLLEQPTNRGTAAGILYPLLRIAELAGDVPVAVFLSDHFVDDDVAFVGAVSAAAWLGAVRLPAAG